MKPIISENKKQYSLKNNFSNPALAFNKETNMTTFGGSGQEPTNNFSPGQNSEELLQKYKNTYEKMYSKESSAKNIRIQ